MNEYEKKKRQFAKKRYSGPVYADEEAATPQPHRERYLAPPRSGNSNDFLPEMFEYNVRDHSDASAKRKFRVRVPTRLLRYVVLVFLIGPLVVFVHREGHIHDNSSENHYKAEHFNHVDTKDVLAHLLDKPDQKNEEASAAKTNSTVNIEQAQAKTLEDVSKETTSSTGNSTSISAPAGNEDSKGTSPVDQIDDKKSKSTKSSSKRRR